MRAIKARQNDRALSRAWPAPTGGLLRYWWQLQFVYAFVRQFVCGFVAWIARMALDPFPGYLVLVCRFVEGLPQVFILYRLFC